MKIIENLQNQTIKLAKKFSTLNKREHQFMNLIEEVGEIAIAIMYFENFKKSKYSGKLTKDDIAYELADVLLNLFLISDQYNINLENKYKRMLKQLQQKVDKDEFN